MINSCVDDNPLFHSGSSADRGRAFLRDLHIEPFRKWTEDDLKMRWTAIVAIQWARRKSVLAHWNGTQPARQSDVVVTHAGVAKLSLPSDKAQP